MEKYNIAVWLKKKSCPISVPARVVEIEGHKFLVHRFLTGAIVGSRGKPLEPHLSTKSWTVTEYRTGLRVCTGDTQKNAVENTKRLLFLKANAANITLGELITIEIENAIHEGTEVINR